MRKWSESKTGWFLDRLNWQYAVKKARREYWAARGALIDLRFGGSTFVNEPTRYPDRGVTVVQSLDYENLAAVMRYVPIEPDDVLVDIGCATGRVINWWLASGVRNRIVGIELDPEIASKTRRRLAGRANVEIIAGDAAELTPRNATLCFVYNPFDGCVLRRWLGNVLKHHTANRLRVVYVYPVHLDAFAAIGNWTISMKSIPWHDVAICDLVQPESRGAAGTRSLVASGESVR